MTIETGILLTCQNETCKTEFRWVPNSTIKPKLCFRCQKLAEFQKSKERIQNNKILLSQSTLYGKNKTTGFKTGKYMPKEQSGLKRLKYAKKSTGFDKTKMKSKTAVMNLADSMFSRFIRLKHSVESGENIICQCYTCKTFKSIKNIECGHWQRRGFKTTRYNENNARPQCKKCNGFRSGEPEKFEINLIKEIGEAEVMKLKELSQQEGEDNVIFYNEMAGLYKYKYEKLCKERGIRNPWTNN